MKYLWVLVLGILVFTSAANAQIMTVTNVKVSITADSAAAAREQALDKAHDLAFQKLLQESFPEKSGSALSHNDIINMVVDFSIDREKTSPMSYTASLTFQFDGSKVQAWTQQPGQQATDRVPSVDPRKTLKVTAFYKSLSEWHHIQKTLEKLPGIQKVTLLAISSQQADMNLIYGGDIEKLKPYFLQQDLVLSPEQEGWILSSNKSPLK